MKNNFDLICKVYEKEEAHGKRTILRLYEDQSIYINLEECKERAKIEGEVKQGYPLLYLIYLTFP